jgi:hypothetical protein
MEMHQVRYFLGECPASQMKADVRPPISHPGKGATDTVLAAIDLEKEVGRAAVSIFSQ